ncbi:MAG: DUF3418 domain-containing protein [Smithella sp.]
MIEWRDIYQQITGIIYDDKIPANIKKHGKTDMDQNLYDKIHKCILSGYISHIAQKKEKNFYLAAKSREVMIYPGSGLFNRAGRWIVAAEITQTSRLFARNVANIKSEWLEEIGKDNCRYTYAAAHWEKSRGQVVALERVTLFGLTIVEKRPVAYERINPEEARSIFIREALVTGEVNRKIPFLEHNLALWQKAIQMEEKLRKRGIVADEEAIARLYEERLPVLSDIRSLLKLIRDKGSDDFLRFREEDFIAVEPDENELFRHPDKIKIGEAVFPCSYNFAPGKSNDGVTMKIPLGLVSKAASENVERFLPSLLQEKTLHLLKSLPKTIRQKLPAAQQIAASFIYQTADSRKALPQSLSQFIQDKYRITIPQEAWGLEKLPTHLNVRYSVIDEKGKEVKVSRDIGQLQEELADTANLSALDKIRPQWERENIVSWDFGTLPAAIPLTTRHGLVGYAYPALQEKDDAINLRLFFDQRESETHHIRGVSALYSIHFADRLKQLKKNIALTGELKLMAAKIGNPKLLEQSLLKRVKADLFRRPWRSGDDFLKHAAVIEAQILQYGQQLLKSIEPVLHTFSDTQALLHKLTLKNRGNNPLLAFFKDTQNELQNLVPIDFAELYSFERMKELPRYLKALALRAERGSLNLAAARNKIENIAVYSQKLQQIIVSAENDVIPVKAGFQELQRLNFTAPDFPEEKRNMIEEFFWMIEEYKVSLFAQELKTPYPVSPKKLDQLIRKIENTI